MSKSELTKVYPPSQAPISTKDNVYIGPGSEVLKGVTLGENAFVAAKSLVINDFEPNTSVGGVSAVLITNIK